MTLIFSLDRYNEVITAWMEGLELALQRRSDVSSIGSVASFFVSRVDVAVDALLPEGDPRRGTTANAQVAGGLPTVSSPHGRATRSRRSSTPARRCSVRCGRRRRRRIPAYFDLLYVDTIVADETVNTMPDATLAATLDHGNFATSELRSDESIERGRGALRAVARQHLARGRDREARESTASKAFVASYEELLATVEGEDRRRTR